MVRLCPRPTLNQIIILLQTQFTLDTESFLIIMLKAYEFDIQFGLDSIWVKIG